MEKALQAKLAISSALIDSARQRLKAGKRVDRKLPRGGRLHIDRQLPFLIVYRRPVDREDPEADLLVRGEASYLIASGDRKQHSGVSALIEGIAQVLSECFGAFLLIELWTASAAEATGGYEPRFRVVRAKQRRLASTAETLAMSLGEIKIKGDFADAEIVVDAKTHPAGTRPLLTPERAAELSCRTIGLEVDPIFRDASSGEPFPLIRRALHKGLSRAIKRAVFEFTRRQTSHRPAHYHALGRQSFIKAVWQIDRELARSSNAFDFLLQVTPVNVDEAWTVFRRGRFEVEPEFSSRPLKIDPGLEKRRLFQIPIERIADPTLAQLFRDQQTEIDRKLTMLGDRGTPRFLYGSMQVFGGVDASLHALAYEILNRIPPRSRDESLRGGVNAKEFARRAEEDLAYYRSQYPEIKSRVEIRSDITGLMVSRGNLLVGASTKIPASRVDALLAHEVGTHIVSYVNGRAQPFQQLSVGLPGYEELQEGMAVLAEYLVGGLSRPRLRLLAARVIAAHRMISGANFIEVFRELHRAQDFAQRTAFTIAMRIFRGGGLTKDVVYLRGLVKLLEYLRKGGDFDRLLYGKFGAEHVPMIDELAWRNVLVDIPLRPRHLELPECRERLAGIRRGSSVLDLIKTRSRT